MDLKIGAKYCSRLENLVRCPVCHKRLTGDVFLCDSGHSICRACTYGSAVCTRCHKPCTSIPNLLARSLLSQLDEIKTCLMELDALKLDQKCGKFDGKSAFELKDELPLGQYRCWISDDCKIIGYAPALIEHCRSIHSREFTEQLDGTLPHRQSWEMNYVANNLNRAFNIPEIGLFILRFWRSEHDLRGCIVMYAGLPMAALHSYMIEIECGEKKLIYNGKVYSARARKNFVFQSKDQVFFIDRHEPLYFLIREESEFKCSVVIEKENRDVTDAINPITINNQVVEQEKTQRRRGCRDKNRGKNELTSNIHSRNQDRLQNHPRVNNASTEELNASKVHSQMMNDHPSTSKQCGAFENSGSPSVEYGVTHYRNANVCEIPPIINNNGTDVPASSMKYEIPPPVNPYFSQDILSLNEIPTKPADPTGLEDSTEKLVESGDVIEESDIKPLDILHRRRCWLNRCRFIAAGPIFFEHLETDHVHQFEEHMADDTPYEKTWNSKYCVNKYYDHAIKIGGLLFIIHMFINKAGELGACVIMYASNQVADSHFAQIEIECNDMKFYKPIKIVTAESPRRVIKSFKCYGFPFARHELIYDELKKSKRFMCTVVMKKKQEHVEEEVKVEGQKRKKRLKSTSMKRKRILIDLKSLITFRNLEIAAQRERYEQMALKRKIRREKRNTKKQKKVERLQREERLRSMDLQITGSIGDLESLIALRSLEKRAKKEKKKQTTLEPKMKKERDDIKEQRKAKQSRRKKGVESMGIQKTGKPEDFTSSITFRNSKRGVVDKKSAFELGDELPLGQYYCWISDRCKYIGYSSILIKHYRSIHLLEFTEHLDGTLPHRQNWQMNYVANNLNRAFKIPRIGLFILCFRRSRHDLRGCIIMHAAIPKASSHSYTIEIECGEKKLTYNGQVYSARAPKNCAFQSKDQVLFIDRNEPLHFLLRRECEFKCSIVIEKKNQEVIDPINPITMNNPVVQQGKGQRRRRGCRDKNRETNSNSIR